MTEVGYKTFGRYKTFVSLSSQFVVTTDNAVQLLCPIVYRGNFYQQWNRHWLSETCIKRQTRLLTISSLCAHGLLHLA